MLQGHGHKHLGMLKCKETLQGGWKRGCSPLFRTNLRPWRAPWSSPAGLGQDGGCGSHFGSAVARPLRVAAGLRVLPAEGEAGVRFQDGQPWHLAL